MNHKGNHKPARSNEQGEYVVNGSQGQGWILEAYRALEPRNYVKEFTSQNVRPDGRPFNSSRPITVLTSFLKRNSYGSAMVTLGGGSDGATSTTRVIAACTLLIGHPGPSTPTHGDIDVILNASPLSGPRFDIMGRESMDSVSVFHNYQQGDNDSPNIGDYDCPQPCDVKEIESWVRRTIRSSRFVDPNELGIEPGKSAWRVRVTIQVLNHDGNIWDAALLCACAALSDLKLPMVEVNRRDGGVMIVPDGGMELKNVDQKNDKVTRRKGRSLTLGPLPVPLTIAILPKSSSNNENESGSSQIMLVDPSRLEEDVSSGNMITVVCNTKEEIVEFHKKGSASRLSLEQIMAVSAMGFGRAKELEPLVITDL